MMVTGSATSETFSEIAEGPQPILPIGPESVPELTFKMDRRSVLELTFNWGSMAVPLLRSHIIEGSIVASFIHWLQLPTSLYLLSTKLCLQVGTGLWITCQKCVSGKKDFVWRMWFSMGTVCMWIGRIFWSLWVSVWKDNCGDFADVVETLAPVQVLGSTAFIWFFQIENENIQSNIKVGKRGMGS